MAEQAQPFFASRADAVAALLRKTQYSSGAKHFSAGGITVHVTDLLMEKKRSVGGALKLEVRLLGQSVHKFDIDVSKAEERHGKRLCNLGQVICFELPPRDLADRLATQPRLELRLYGRDALQRRSGQQRVVVNGAERAAEAEEGLLAVAEHDLAAMTHDVVGAKLPLEWADRPDDDVDASTPFGELVVSVVAERRGESGRRAEGGGVPGSLSGYGTGDPRALYAADGATTTSAAAAATAAAAAAIRVGGGDGSRPPSRGSAMGGGGGGFGGSQMSFHDGELGGVLGGPGSVVSLGGGGGGGGMDALSSGSQRVFFDTPVGFQYKAIPRRFLTPPRSRSPFGDEDGGGARSDAGGSANGGGGGGGASVFGRSHVSLGASTAVGSLASSGVAGGGGGGGSINSHAIAEAFWTRWREKQLPEGVPPREDGGCW